VEGTDKVILDSDYTKLWSFSMCFLPGNTHIITNLYLMEENRDFYLIPLDGGEPELFEIDEYPNTPGNRGGLERSADGKWIVYTKMPPRSDERSEYYIDVYNPETREAKNLFPRGKYNGSPCLSPDGSKVCYTQSDNIFSETSEIYVLDIDFESFEPSPRGPDPWADEEKPEDLAYAQVGPEYGTRLDIFNEYSGEFGDRTKFEIYKRNPAWSPDGKWIAFTDQQYTQIFIVPARGGDAVRIYHNDNNWVGDESGQTVYSSHIRELCFTADSQEVTFQLNVFDVERGSFLKILDSGGFQLRQQIPDIESVNIYTGEHRVLVNGGFHPSWSGDGRYLAYINFDERIWTDELLAENTGVPAIYDTGTGETRYLSDDVVHHASDLYGNDGYGGYWNNKYMHPTFSPDGSHIVLSIMETDNAQLYRIPFEGGEPEQLTFLENKVLPEWEIPNQCELLEYSPDGQWIIFSRSENTQNHPVLYNTSTGELFDAITGKEYNDPVNIRDEGVVGGIWGVGWSPDGDQLYLNLVLLDDRGVLVATPIYICNFYPENYGKVVMVEAEEQSSFALLRNYPNPFNPATIIEFTVPEAGFTEIVIYNMAGQKIRELVSADMTPGVHSVVWDGCDENGTPVSSGVYISHLKTGDNVFSNRMMLVK